MDLPVLLFNFYEFFGHTPAEAGIIVLNLILIESILSIDNALVMGTMVRDLPKHQQGKALRWGIFGAYFFRALAIVLVSWLLSVVWLKALGGLYLVWLALDYFRTKSTPDKHDDTLSKEDNMLYKYTVGKIGKFWSTVFLVEVMDLTFSIDNVFAAVAYTDNIYLIMLGVFIGILAIRFVAQGAIKLMDKFPFLSGAAFLIIGILGVKLILSYVCHEFGKNTAFCKLLDSERTDLYVSLLTISIFIVPVFTSWLFNFPKKQIDSVKQNPDEPEQKNQE